jgi:hypothetical protein
MEHEVIVRQLQFAWEFACAFGPVFGLAGITWWVKSWGRAK